MEITICGSMTFFEEMKNLSIALIEKGHKVNLPEKEEPIDPEMSEEELAKRKIEKDLIMKHYKLIKKSDAILVVNEGKKGIRDYVGGNAFLEMGFAHVLGKKIFLLNDIPQQSYTSEIIAMNPICLKRNLSELK
jgi:predicted RNA-binding protein with PUA domain